MMIVEQNILISAIILSFLILWFTFRAMKIMEWATILFSTACVSSFIATWLINEGYYYHPYRLLPNIFSIAITFDYVAFPALTILYNYTSESSKLRWIIGQATLYAAGLTIVEEWIEQNTELIRYRTWTWVHTFISATLTLLAIRGFMALIRKIEKNRVDS